MRQYEARLKQCAAEVVDRRCAQALRLARTQPRERFAQTYLNRLPPGPLQGHVWADLNQLSTGELLALARLNHADLPDFEAMPPAAIRRYFAEQEQA